MYFENESTAGFLNETGTDLDTSVQKPARRLQSVVPVCIRQLRDTSSDDFSLFGMPTQILCIVGILKDYEVQSTKAMYNIEDHTGNIKAIWWLENDSETAPKLPVVKEGSYVQVFGSLRTQETEKIFMVLRMFLIEDADVVTNHLLQVIHVRYEAENLTKTEALAMKHNPISSLANSMSFLDENVANNGQNCLTGIHKKVYDLFLSKSYINPDVPLADIMENFSKNEHPEVRRVIDFLCEEGHIYSSIDDFHFKVTNGPE